MADMRRWTVRRGRSEPLDYDKSLIMHEMLAGHAAGRLGGGQLSEALLGELRKIGRRIVQTRGFDRLTQEQRARVLDLGMWRLARYGMKRWDPSKCGMLYVTSAIRLSLCKAAALVLVGKLPRAYREQLEAEQKSEKQGDAEQGDAEQGDAEQGDQDNGREEAEES